MNHTNEILIARNDTWIIYGFTHGLMALVFCLVTTVASGQSSLLERDSDIERFTTEYPLQLTLYASFDLFEQQFDTETYMPAKIKYTDSEGVLRTKKVKVKSRGVYRKSICQLPPIKIKFTDKDYGVDVFDNAGSMKLVNQCDQTNAYNQYVLKEYMCYKIYESLTEQSFKTFLIDLTVVNADNSDEHYSSLAFFIENESKMARRNNCVVIKTEGIDHEDLDYESEGLFSLFQYMIGNTDFGVSSQHNVKIIRRQGNIQATPIAVPYDFDFSGLVNASYVKPDRKHGLRSVRDRLYFGNCMEKPDLDSLLQLFLHNKDKILRLIESNMLLEEEHKNESLEYITEFYRTITDKRLLKKHIYRKCW